MDKMALFQESKNILKTSFPTLFLSKSAMVHLRFFKLSVPTDRPSLYDKIAAIFCGHPKSLDLSFLAGSKEKKKQIRRSDNNIPKRQHSWLFIRKSLRSQKSQNLFDF